MQPCVSVTFTFKHLLRAIDSTCFTLYGVFSLCYVQFVAMNLAALSEHASLRSEGKGPAMAQEKGPTMDQGEGTTREQGNGQSGPKGKSIGPDSKASFNLSTDFIYIPRRVMALYRDGLNL